MKVHIEVNLKYETTLDTDILPGNWDEMNSELKDELVERWIDAKTLVSCEWANDGRGKMWSTWHEESADKSNPKEGIRYGR